MLEYDDVLNTQRKTVYARRRGILLGSEADIENALNDIINSAPQLAEGAPTLEMMQKVIADKIAQFGREKFYFSIRQVMLQTIDTLWVEHLEVMDYTRSSVNLRAYGQRDPLVEYKKEGLRLFREMQTAINAKIVSLLPHISDGVATPQQVQLKETRDSALLAQQNGNGVASEAAATGGNRQQRRAAAAKSK